MSHAMGLGKSTIYGLVNTLLSYGYLEQNQENKRYRLGLKLFKLGSLVQQRMDIRDISRPYLKMLSEQFNMTVHMGYIVTMRLFILINGLAQHLITYSQVGERAPMHCTGIGKAVLSYLEQDERERILRNMHCEPFTKHTIVDKDKLAEELDLIRARGYAVDNEEIELGLRCVAVPIFNDQGRPVAAISISSSTAHLDEAKVCETASAIKEVAYSISRKLGYEKS